MKLRTPLQRSRALSSAEIASPDPNKPIAELLQRSRALSSAEIRQRSARFPRRRRFNGAALFRARRLRSTRGDLKWLRCFNGAALFRARRCCFTSDRMHRCGHCFNGAALFRARRYTPPARSLHPAPSFNGAALFRARRYRNLEKAGALIAAASTEPRSFERGDEVLNEETLTSGVASTEPRSFERGDPTTIATSSPARSLQRSRALSSAEIAISTRFSKKAHCFNGAALFRARRSRPPTRLRGWLQRFNGAALFRARR